MKMSELLEKLHTAIAVNPAVARRSVLVDLPGVDKMIDTVDVPVHGDFVYITVED